MAIEYMGLNNIQGPLAVIEGVDDTFYEEMVTVTLDNGEKRIGRVIEISGDKAVIQVFEGTSNLSLTNTKTKFMGEPMAFCRFQKKCLAERLTVSADRLTVWAITLRTKFVM